MRLPVWLTVPCVLAFSAVHAGDAPYAGQDERPNASLSDGDIAELVAGGGWGLAKPAELNGWPGPRHVLDLSSDLGLSGEQLSRIEMIHSAMNVKAKALGRDLIERERAIDQAFESGDIDRERLDRLLAAAEAVRADLRRAHLDAHIETAPLLTRHQKMAYQRLRGYGDHGGHAGHSGHN
jgi:Spy/CpxP family protein refolding chaperone